jgi:hypothetical protein
VEAALHRRCILPRTGAAKAKSQFPLNSADVAAPVSDIGKISADRGTRICRIIGVKELPG